MSTSYTLWSNAVNRTSLSRLATCRIRSSPCTTLARPWVRRAVDCSEFLLASSLPSVPSATGSPALFEDFLGTTELSDCSRLFIIGVRPQTSRCTPPRHLRRGDRSSPGSQPRCFHACAGSQTSWGPRMSGDLTSPSVWPSARGTASAPQFPEFRGSIPGLHVPLPTLGTLPHDRPPMAWGRYGSPTFTARLLPSLHPGGLSRRFPTFHVGAEPGSRRLYAGCRLGRKQVPPRLVPSRSAFPVSASLESLSTRLQRFACARLPGSHLTLSWSAVSATFTTPAVVPAQLAAVGNLRLRGGSEGPTLIANAALLRVVLSTWDYLPH